MIHILYFIIFYLSFMWIIPIFILIAGFFNKKVYNYDYYLKYLNKFFNYKINYVKEEERIEKGFIFSNHRSWADIPIDYSITKYVICGRYLAGFAMGFVTLLQFRDNNIILFNRGTANRKTVYQLCKNKISYKDRILIYPEGSRMNYQYLESKDDIKNKLKKGLIKEIYQRNEFPIQLQITSNKEKVCNEKKFEINYNTSLNCAISKSIHPKDYSSFEEFLDKISEEWFELWKLTHL